MYVPGDQGRRPNGGAFYDAPGVLEAYARERVGEVSSPNEVMETPAVLEVLGDVRGARVVDLGCGDGRFGAWLLAHGAASYHGVDGSAGMIGLAERAVGGAGRLTLAALEEFDTEQGSVDLVVSRLALHYVEPLDALLARCRAWLSPRGRLLLIVLHPVVTSHDARASTDEPRTNWVVDDYFRPGPRPQEWMGGSVVFHHRTVEQYVDVLARAGFRLTVLRECEPVESAFHGDRAEFERRRRIPLFLLLGASPS